MSRMCKGIRREVSPNRRLIVGRRNCLFNSRRKPEDETVSGITTRAYNAREEPLQLPIGKPEDEAVNGGFG